MTPVIAPFSRGSWTGFCGVYAIINALRLAFEHRSAKLQRSEWQELFFALLAKVDDGVGGICHVIARGMTAKRLRTIAKSAERHLSEEYELDVSIEPLFARDDRPSMAELFVTIAKSTERGEPVIADFAGRLNHWTVIRAVTGQSLLLFDSGGLTRVTPAQLPAGQTPRIEAAPPQPVNARSILRVRCLFG